MLSEMQRRLKERNLSGENGQKKTGGGDSADKENSSPIKKRKEMPKMVMELAEDRK